MELKDLTCSLELARKIKELGVVEESIFFYEWSGAKELSINENHKPYYNIDGINAYTVAELLNILPSGIHEQDILVIERWENGYSLAYKDYGGSGKQFRGDTHKLSLFKDTLENALAKMLIHLIENKYVKINN